MRLTELLAKYRAMPETNVEIVDKDTRESFRAYHLGKFEVENIGKLYGLEVVTFRHSHDGILIVTQKEETSNEINS